MPDAKGSEVYNAVIIGAGTAGLVTAAGTAGLGGRVALIERSRMGGDCLNVGCVPSKALISSARLLHQIAHAERWGLERQEPQFHWENVFGRMRARRAEIAPVDSQERFESLGVDVFRGEAKFLSPYEVEVNGQRLRAKNFVIAAGSRASIPAIAGLDDVPYFTNETIFDKLDRAPASMAVVGGGPIGCELAQACARFGVKITIVNSAPRLLPKEDEEVAAFAEQRFLEEGITIVNHATVQSAARHGEVIELTVRNKTGGAEQRLTVSALLLAAGRTPNLDALNLEAAGVERTEHGVAVNVYLQTTQPHIYAAGDIAGPFHFTHMADYQARVVTRNILMPFQFLRQKTDYRAVPWCTYLDPEIARVGLSETEAKERNIDYDVLRQEMRHVGRAVVEDQASGFAKVLVRRGTDKILGATMVAEHAGDLLHEFVLAMKHGIGLAQISSTIHVYPTYAEVARKIGDQYNKTRLTPFARQLFGWLYRRYRS